MAPSTPAEAAVARASGKPAPEINLGRLRVLVAQVIEHRIDALMIALDCCTRSMQLQDARQNLQGRDRHVVLRLFCSASRSRTKGRCIKRARQYRPYNHSIATTMWRAACPVK